MGDFVEYKNEGVWLHFSAVGVLCTKLRNCLQDKTLDTLCLLRVHYARKI